MQTALLAVFVFIGMLAARPAAMGGMPAGGDLAEPFAVAVDGVPIDVPPGTRGRYHDDNEYPWTGDFDGDGQLDLLVGQAGHEKSREGHLRIYRGLDGKNGKGGPRLAAPVWFHDLVPTGRIPKG